MEWVRMIKRIWFPALIVLCMLAGICVLDIRNDEDTKVYAYYQEIADYYYEQGSNLSNSEVVQSYMKNVYTGGEDENEYIHQAIALFNNQFDYIKNYNNNLTGKISQSESILKSSLYSDRRNYGRLNILKTRADMLSLKDISVSFCNTYAIEKLIKFDTLPIMLMVLMMVIVFSIAEERKSKLWHIVHLGVRGRYVLAVKRCGILFILSVLLSYLSNGLIFGVYLMAYGGAADLGKAIQSSSMFQMFHLQVTIGQFFIIYCLVFAVGIFSVSLIMLFFSLFIQSPKLAMISMIGVYIIEYLLYRFIPGNSHGAFLKYVNLYNIMMMNRSYVTYENWGYRGFITDVLTTTGILTVAVTVIFAFGTVMLGARQRPENDKGRLQKPYEKGAVLFQKCFSKLPVMMMEIYKTLVSQNGFIILVIGIYLISTCRIYRGVDYTQQSPYIKDFYNKFEGYGASAEINEYIDSEQKKVDDYVQNHNLKANDTVVQEARQGIRQMREISVYIDEMHQNGNYDVIIVDPAAYSDILGRRLYHNQENINLLCVFIIIMIVAGIFAYERKCNMYPLQRVCSSRNVVWRNKLTVVIVFTVIVWLISAWLNWMNILKIYKLHYISAPIQSLMQYKEFPLSVSIGGYLVLCQLYRLFMLLMLGLIVFGISVYFKYIMTLCISAVILVPHILYLFGMEKMYYLSCVSAMDFNRLWCWSGNHLLGYILPVVIAFAAIILLAFSCKKWGSIRQGKTEHKVIIRIDYMKREIIFGVSSRKK